MKTMNNTKIIGIGHGYGNMKTANCCFPTGVLKSNTEPVFTGDLLVWEGRYYSIGVGHKEFTANKFTDEEYYVLTLAAIARELRREQLTEARLFIAAGLPLTWVSEQKTEFKDYLLQRREIEFTFRNTSLSYSDCRHRDLPTGLCCRCGQTQRIRQREYALRHWKRYNESSSDCEPQA